MSAWRSPLVWWREKDGFERVVVIVLLLAVVVLGAFALRPGLVGTKIPFRLLVPVFAIFSLAHAVYLLGWRHALDFLVITSVVSLGAELAGTTSGLIFGHYHYTEALGPKLFGEVPLLIPAAWFLMIYPSWMIANLIVQGRAIAKPRNTGELLWLSAVGAMVMTAWDLTLDPYMVGVERAWVWDQPGGYFDIPLQNYIGWLLTSFVVLVLVRLTEHHIEPRPWGSRDRWVLSLPLLSYGFQSLGDVLLGQPEPTVLISPFAMGIPLLFAGTALLRGGRTTVSKGSST